MTRRLFQAEPMPDLQVPRQLPDIYKQQSSPGAELMAEANPLDCVWHGTTLQAGTIRRRGRNRHKQLMKAATSDRGFTICAFSRHFQWTDVKGAAADNAGSRL